MSATPEADLKRQQATAQVAYKRLMTSRALLRRRGLSPGETGKAQAIHSEAFGTLRCPRIRTAAGTALQLGG